MDAVLIQHKSQYEEEDMVPQIQEVQGGVSPHQPRSQRT